jgi:hypothetical protein
MEICNGSMKGDSGPSRIPIVNFRKLRECSRKPRLGIRG